MSTNQLALVTGAGGGIGSQVVKKLADGRYDLWLVDKHKVPLDALCHNSANFKTQQVDLSVQAQVSRLCQQIQDCEQHIDVAIVNAGIVIPNKVIDNTPEDIDAQIDINLRSSIHLIHSLTRKMLEQGHGNIIVTVSMGAIIALEGSAMYSASKFGLRGFILALQHELRGTPVKVTAVYASGVDTPMLEYEARNNGNSLNFLAQPLAPERVAQAIFETIKTGKESIYLPYLDSLSARLVCAFPWIIYPLYPLFKRLGEKGRKKYLQKIQNRH